MKTFIAYQCERCSKIYTDCTLAGMCESKHRKEDAEYAERQKYEQDRIKELKRQGFSEWVERSGRKQAKTVDPKKFGPHKYPDEDCTSDCTFGCGCWMGPSNSGGDVDPFGACPKNNKD